MADLTGTVQANNMELAKILGVSAEMASTFIYEGHVVLCHEQKLTFLRLHDIYRSLRKPDINQSMEAPA